ncbi:hypothetical protein [Streptomyces luteogriseus]|uniref:hypothetical protein n=1 Tax=Streptomyces luteogriseus TaxID=68233 RepID=UPI0037F346DE
MSTSPPAATPNTLYIHYMFDEIAPFCDPTFLAVHKTFFYQAITGVLMEGHFTPQACDQADSDYVRIFNGFSQFWFTSLQFTHPCLSARSHQAFR